MPFSTVFPHVFILLISEVKVEEVQVEKISVFSALYQNNEALNNTKHLPLNDDRDTDKI